MGEVHTVVDLIFDQTITTAVWRDISAIHSGGAFFAFPFFSPLFVSALFSFLSDCRFSSLGTVELCVLGGTCKEMGPTILKHTAPSCLRDLRLISERLGVSHLSALFLLPVRGAPGAEEPSREVSLYQDRRICLLVNWAYPKTSVPVLVEYRSLHSVRIRRCIAHLTKVPNLTERLLCFIEVVNMIRIMHRLRA